LPEVDWAAMLPRPIDDVRRELGIDELPIYEPVRTHAVPGNTANPRWA
jgi:hypothetical protein